MDLLSFLRQSRINPHLDHQEPLFLSAIAVIILKAL